MARNIKLRIWRGDSTDGGLKDVVVEANEGEVVLDVIHRVQATQMGDLAVRWNCKAGKCGSCSMEINGKPRLACMTQVASFGEEETITVTPLRAFPIIKDLVTDVSFNYKKAMEVPAYEFCADLEGGNQALPYASRNVGQQMTSCSLRDREQRGTHLGKGNIRCTYGTLVSAPHRSAPCEPHLEQALQVAHKQGFPLLFCS